MRDVTRGLEPAPAYLEANCLSDDCEALLRDFEYSTSWILPDGIQNILDDEDANVGCECETGKCDNDAIDCGCVFDYGHYFDSSGLLQLDSLPNKFVLYECCSTCDCVASGSCANQVTQHGLTTKCSVRLAPGKGFGLFAEEPIPKGSFLCCYVGEVISSQEAKDRWAWQKEHDKGNYILVLKETMTNKKDHQILRTTIDARVKGNIGHFLNHACPPLTTHIVSPVRTIGSLIPRPAFFAVRDIAAGEELTWDYSDAGGESWFFGRGQNDTTGIKPIQEEQASSTLLKETRTPCLCGSSRCRKWMAYDPNL